ncbi:MAG: phosphatase PAP2 family protein [Promethearchaeota archaeon]
MNQIPESPTNENDGNKFSTFFPNIDKWDKEISLRLYGNPKLQKYARLWQIISFFGDPRLWGPVIIGFGVYGIVQLNFELVTLFLAAFFQSFLIYYAIKKYFKRTRPFKQFSEVNRLDKTGHGYGFPSGHCHHSVILVWLIFFLWLPPWAIPLLVLFNGLIGFSRIMLGVHYPSDIIVGTIEAYIEILIFWYGTKIIYLNIYSIFFTIIFG